MVDATAGRPETNEVRSSWPSAIELRLGDGSGSRGAGTGVEQAQLTEHLARAQDGQEVLAAVDAGEPELDLALSDHVEPITAVTLAKEDVATFKTRRRHRLHQGFGGARHPVRRRGVLVYDINVHGAQSARACVLGSGPSTVTSTLAGVSAPSNSETPVALTRRARKDLPNAGRALSQRTV